MFQKFYGSIRDAIKGLARIPGIEESVSKTSLLLKRVFRHVCVLLEAVISLSTGIFSVVHGNATMAALGVASITTAIFRYTNSVQQQEEYVYEADEGGVWSRFIGVITSKSASLGHLMRTQFSPNSVLNAASRYFSSMGYRVDLLKNIYNRERLKDPDMNPLISAVLSVVKYFIEGSDYMFNADEEFAVGLASACNEVEHIVNEFSFSSTYTFNGVSGKPGDLLSVMRKRLADLRLESAMVNKQRETKLFTLSNLIDKLAKKIGKSNLLTTSSEPASMILMGDPGVGKSVMSVYLLPAVLNWMLKDHEAYKRHYVDFAQIPYSEHYQRVVHTYASNEHLKFDSLYDGQPMIVVDDAFTERTAQDASFITRIVNSATMEVPKADVPDKGEVYRSDFVFVTTNVKDPIATAANYINCPEKLVRRFGLMVRMEKVKGVAPFHFSQLGKLDSMTMDMKYDAICKLMAEKFVFTRMKYDKLNIREDGRITFAQIVEHMKERFEINHHYIHENLDLLAGMSYQMNNSNPFIDNLFEEIQFEQALPVTTNSVSLQRDMILSVLQFADSVSAGRRTMIRNAIKDDPDRLG